MFKFEWIADSEFFSYIIDKLQFFNDLLIHMKHQQIKVEKEHLYFYICEMIIMQIDSENSIKLSSTFYVFELEINLFLKK